MASLKYAVDIDTKGARAQLNSLQGSIGGLGKAIAGAFAVRELVGFGDELIGLRNRLTAFTSSQAEANAQFSQIAEIAGRSRAGLAETGALYNKMAIAADSMGVSTAEVGRITETFAKSLKVGGANAQESASAILQFSQAMGSGVLRGEEFNAVFEASSSTMLDIAKAMDVPIGQMRELAKEGKLTASVISQAILKMTDSVEDKFAKTIPTMTEAFTNLKTAAGIALTEIANEGDSPAAALGALAQSILQLTQDIPALTAAIKDLVNILTYAGIAMVAFRGYAFVATGAFKTFQGVIATFGKNIGSATLGMGALGAATTSIRNGLVGLGSAFGIVDKSRGSIMKTTASLGTMGTSMARISQIGLSLSTILSGMLRIGLRFAGWVGVFLAVVDVINFLYKALTGSNEKLIDLGSIFKGIITVVRVVYGLIAALGNYIGQKLAPYVQMAAQGWRNLMSAIMDNGPMRAAASMLDWVGSRLAALWNLAKQISGVTAADTKAAMDRVMAGQIDFDAERAAMGIAPKAVAPPAAGGGGKGGKGGGGRSQAEINQELLKSINDITRAYREQAGDRLDALKLDVQLLGVSQDQAELERSKADILRNQRDTLAELSDKELEVKENNELTAASRKKNLDLIAQQRVAVNAQAAEELAKTEELIRAKQKFAIEQERVLNLTKLQQQANENAVVLQELEDQLKLVGLFGDELENQTIIMQAQQKIRRIELEYSNELLDLERRRAEIGEKRYQNELTYITAIRDASVRAANERVAAEQRVVAATRKTERTDINRAIKKRMEELERSIDPAVLAVQKLDSVFDNMGRAIDNFVDTGKFKFGDFARSIIADIAKIELKAAATKILTSVLGSIFGKKAAGGPVKGNTPYLVGENGPELFVPGSMGSVMPNHALNKNAGTGESMAPVINNTYITNNINALDSRSVAQVFVENRKSLLGAASMASKEMPYGG